MHAFRRWWGRASTPMLGVDIGNSGVRVMELVRAGRQLQIAHYAHRRLPPGAIRDGSVVMHEEIAESLHDALRESGSQLRHAALALPPSAVIKKILSLPALSGDDELELHIESEATALLPVAREELGVDFAVVGPSTHQPDSIDVLLVAARQEKINERVELVTAIGLKPLIMDVESNALLAAVSLMLRSTDIPPQALLGVLHIEAEQVYAYFIQDGSLVFERQLGSPLARKESDVVETLSQEFSRAYQLSQTASGSAGLHHVYLLGAAAADLQSILSMRLSVGVSPLDPWQQLPAKPGVSAGEHEHPSACALVCGLALRGFDA